MTQPYHKNSLIIKILTGAKIFDWVRGGDAIHVQWRHQNFSKGGIFIGQRYRKMEGQKPGSVCVAQNHDFAKGEDLQFNQKLWSFPKISKLVDVVS